MPVPQKSPPEDATEAAASEWIAATPQRATPPLTTQRRFDDDDILLTASADQRHRLFATIVEDSVSEILVFDPQTMELALVNRSGRNNLGYTKEELTHLSAASIKADCTPEIMRETLRALLSGRTKRLVTNTWHRRKDGTSYPVVEHSQTASFGGRTLIYQIVVDQTEASRLEAQSELLSRIEIDGAHFGYSEVFIRAVLRRVSRYLGCSAGHAFIWRNETASLYSSGAWHFEAHAHWHARFREAVEAQATRPGQGLAGRVYLEKAAMLIADLTAEPAFAQGLVHSDIPIRSILSIPVFVNNDVAAVLEFYAIMRIDSDLLQHGFSEKISMQVSRLFERKRAEEDLAETRERFEAAVRGANVGLWDYNHRSGKSFMSARCKEILSITPETPTDYSSFLDRVHPEDIERQTASMATHLMQRVPYDAEYRVRRPDGGYTWVHARGQGVWDERGDIVRSMGTIDDVTTKKEAEFLRHEVMALMAADGDTSRKIEATLEKACRYLRMPVGVISHVTDDQYEVLYSVSPPDLAPRGKAMPLAQTICSDVFLSGDGRACHDLGDSPLRNHPGRNVMRAEAYLGGPFFVKGARFGTLCFMSSVPRTTPFDESEVATMRLLALWIGDAIGRESYIAALIENDMRKTANLASVGDAVLNLSQAGMIEDANPAAAALFGRDGREICCMHISQLVPSTLSLSDPDGRLMPVSARHDMAIHRDGRRIAVLLHIAEVRLPDRIVYTAALTDWTAVKQAETAKREFVSVVSHELRTPLTSIRGALGLIAAQRTGPLTPATANLVSIAQKNSERLVRLVNDILDMEKLDSGRFELDLRPVDLSAMLQDSIAANTAYAGRFNVTFELTVEPRLPFVIADGDRLMQVMANLLSNAAKFTRPDTTVRIEARTEGNQARVLVLDQGPGVPASLKSHLFEKFAQGDNSNTREREGSGLGLSISRQLARAMNGEVGLASTSSEGSVFYVELPFVQSRASAAEPQKE